ncbi:MAG TPA: hypothetical protein VII82_07120 [Polyangiaceae bacterium]|jgi:hypothetical protein
MARPSHALAAFACGLLAAAVAACGGKLGEANANPTNAGSDDASALPSPVVPNPDGSIM